MLTSCTSPYRANERTISAGKKTIMPQDVLDALDQVEFGFMRPQLEAEFASELLLPPPLPPRSRGGAEHNAPPFLADQQPSFLSPSPPEFNHTQTSKRSTYRRKVAAAKRADKGPGGAELPADASVLSAGGDTTLYGEDGSALDGGGGDTAPPRAKKLKTDASLMDLDDYDDAPSDAETVPDEHVEEEEDDDDDVVEQEEEDDDGEGRDGGEDEPDRLEERRRIADDDDDEALDGDDSE